MIKYEAKLRELSKFVLELANSEEYLCSKFEEGLSLEIRKKMSITETQSYKEVVQLALRVEKLTSETISCNSFQKMKWFSFILGQSTKKIRSLDSFGSSFNSINSPKSFQTPHPSKLGTSPLSFTFKGRQTFGAERCTNCR